MAQSVPRSSKKSSPAKGPSMLNKLETQLGGLMERPWTAALLLLAWALVLLLPGITLFPVNDRDEAKFGRAAIEMAERNEWMLPTFDNDFVSNPDKELQLPEYKTNDKGETELKSQGDYRFDKPVGVYWLMRLSLMAFGEKEYVDAQGKSLKTGPLMDEGALSEAKEAGRINYLPTPRTDAALRLPSILSSWVVALVVFAFGRQLYSARSGFLAAFAWLSCLQVLIHGRLIVADMPMIAAVSLAMFAAWKLLFGREKISEQSNFEQAPSAKQKKTLHWGNFWWWLWVLALAWGFLVKGPIAWAVPVAALLLMRWLFLRRKIGGWRWRKLAPLSTSLVVLGLVALWAVPANLATNWEYTKVGLGIHVVERSVSSFNSRPSVPLVYYLIFAPLSLMPWSGLIPMALGRKNTDEKRDPRRAFLLAWLLSPYLIFSPLSTQLPHYVLPGFPAFFLLLMRFGWPKVQTKLQKNWLLGVWALGMLLAGIILVFYFRSAWADGFDLSIGVDFRGRNEQVEGFKLLILSVAGIFVALSTALALTQLKRPLLAVALSMLLCAYLSHELARGLRKSSPTIAVEKILQEQEQFLGEEFRHLRSWKHNEPSLVYYAGREWSKGGEPKTVERWLKDIDEQFLLVKYRSWRLDEKSIVSLWKGEAPEPIDDYGELLEDLRGDDQTMSFIPVQGYNPATSSWVKLYVVVKLRLSEQQQQTLEERIRRIRRDQQRKEEL